jgi:hypothetical protein
MINKVWKNVSYITFFSIQNTNEVFSYCFHLKHSWKCQFMVVLFTQQRCISSLCIVTCSTVDEKCLSSFVVWSNRSEKKKCNNNVLSSSEGTINKRKMTKYIYNYQLNLPVVIETVKAQITIMIYLLTLLTILGSFQHYLSTPDRIICTDFILY